MFDLLLQGGTLIDGTGAAARPADVAVAGDRIAGVGQFERPRAARVIDITGRVVCPGFIDVHNHDEGWLLRTPHLECKTSQGFTSEVLMSDGISYAPLRADLAHDWLFYLRSLDSLTTSEYRGWESIADFMALLDRRNAQNTIAQIPFANLRVMACGWGRAPADDLQVNLMREEVRRAMSEGAVGISTGLDYISQCFSSTDEIVRVAEAMAPWRGVYATHVRYKDGTLRGVQEAVEIGRRAGVPVHISHLKSPAPREAEALLDYIDRVAVQEVDFSFDVYPYTPGSSLLCSLLPYEVWEDGPLAAPARLREPRIRRLFGEVFRQFNTPLEQIRLVWLAGRDNAALEGQSLAQIVAAHGGSVGDALCDLLIDEHFAVLTIFHTGPDELSHPFLQHSRQMVGSDGIYHAHGPVHPRVYGTASRMLGPLVRDARLFSLETAVYKLAGYAAERFGLVDRGHLRPGAFADLVVFDPATVADRATYESPRQSSTGISHVWVNGVAVVDEGAPVALGAGELPGRALRFRQ